MFTSKIAIVVREDLAVWQKLNVTAFLMSGITARYDDIIGASYQDAHGYPHLPLCGQPVIVLSASPETLSRIRQRAREREVITATYIEEMFTTGHDEANRAVFSESDLERNNVVGIGLRADRKQVDKITKGAVMHS
ncbi:DUF2000 family protein [Halomonas huangheensis]|uniref:DUF2000 family protein n=1 Tax=Halomonas huangheensis TaxID=1178482 RepID=W1N4R0_9GAMM|nr:DUF2000 family protein [Halomonas huangheensis]ALM51972.1 hypothetical protein AR456_06530 [Halomonas huangheensis]ERL50513.1 hypothetical protein BJB45_05135 [Halomonas huangheensis]